MLKKERIKLHLNAKTKEELLEELVSLAIKSGIVCDRNEVIKGLKEREKLMSTGLEHGIAIPHTKAAISEDVVLFFGRKKSGIDFDSSDGQSARLFFLMIASNKVSGPHIRVLAEITKRLQDEKTRQKLLEANNEEEVLKILKGMKITKSLLWTE